MQRQPYSTKDSVKNPPQQSQQQHHALLPIPPIFAYLNGQRRHGTEYKTFILTFGSQKTKEKGRKEREFQIIQPIQLLSRKLRLIRLLSLSQNRVPWLIMYAPIQKPQKRFLL